MLVFKFILVYFIGLLITNILNWMFGHVISFEHLVRLFVKIFQIQLLLSIDIQIEILLLPIILVIISELFYSFAINFGSLNTLGEKTRMNLVDAIVGNFSIVNVNLRFDHRWQILAKSFVELFWIVGNLLLELLLLTVPLICYYNFSLSMENYNILLLFSLFLYEILTFVKNKIIRNSKILTSEHLSPIFKDYKIIQSFHGTIVVTASLVLIYLLVKEGQIDFLNYYLLAPAVLFILFVLTSYISGTEKSKKQREFFYLKRTQFLSDLEEEIQLLKGKFSLAESKVVTSMEKEVELIYHSTPLIESYFEEKVKIENVIEFYEKEEKNLEKDFITKIEKKKHANVIKQKNLDEITRYILPVEYITAINHYRFHLPESWTSEETAVIINKWMKEVRDRLEATKKDKSWISNLSWTAGVTIYSFILKFIMDNYEFLLQSLSLGYN